ncbi:BART domain [Trypanosoma melophagium]|uniref:BART domain n=1 Tax=Trypanosoma melophagium TaxID=715481 RepID=UPI00351A851C|nr:BART domain [Trypanosoma melophagium]
MEQVALLECLDTFFGEGANTDAIGNFLSEEQSVMQLLDQPHDSSEALELYSLFKRYSTLVDSILHAFTEREAANGTSVSLEELADAVMQEWNQDQDYARYLCTAYVAGALDFESFKQLVRDVNEITTYPVGDELSNDDDDDDHREDA